jgi:hypothetical protein
MLIMYISTLVKSFLVKFEGNRWRLVEGVWRVTEHSKFCSAALVKTEVSVDAQKNYILKSVHIHLICKEW